jgi:hypothetical protein
MKTEDVRRTHFHPAGAGFVTTPHNPSFDTEYTAIRNCVECCHLRMPQYFDIFKIDKEGLARDYLGHRVHGSNPASPVWPAHTTMHVTVFKLSSSGIILTTWPRLRGKIALNLKPSCELSRTKQGSRSSCRPGLTTRLAGFFKASRSNRRRSGTGALGICVGRLSPST